MSEETSREMASGNEVLRRPGVREPEAGSRAGR